MEFELWFTAVLVIAMSVLLLLEWLEVEVVLFSMLLFLLLGGVVTVKEAFAGFSNEGVLTIALLFVIAGAVQNSGIMRRVNLLIFGKNQGSHAKILVRILFPVSFISAFLNNTPLVAMLIPAVRSWTDKYHLSPSQFLLPISYAAILGGMCTLIGTSTNLIVHGLMIEYGLEGMTLFEISKFGVPLALAGILFIVVAAPRLLPNRKKPLVELGEHTREFVIELKVSPDYENVGKTIEQAGLRHLKGLFLFQIERSGKIIAPAQPEETIQIGDRLFFTGIPETILELQQTPGLMLTKDSHFDLKQYDASEIKTFECVVSPTSPLIGKTVRESNFRSVYGAVIIAIHRHGERIQKKIGDIVLKPGDTLLLLADKNFRQKWYYSRDFYLIATAFAVPSKPAWQGYFSLGIFLLMLMLTLLGGLPLLSAAALSVGILMLTRNVTPSEVREMLDWRVLIIIAISLGIAQGVQKSGLADALAAVLVRSGRGFGPMGVLISIFVLTSVYTTIITNNAAAALVFPIAISAAHTLSADPRAFAFAVLIAAAGSFATPISYQTNLMVYGPGGYKFVDFLKIGIPLQLLVGVLGLGLIHLFYF